MKVKQNILFILSSLFIFNACITGSPHVSHKEKYQGEDPAIVERFNRGYDLLGEENYQAAAQIFDELDGKTMGSQLALIIKFNAAAAYEGLNECKQAGRRYREIVRIGQEKFPKIQAEALVRLSYAYECLGADTKVVSTLLDALKRKKYLSNEKIKTEIPARLGLSYMRIREFETAKKFHRLAERGVQSLSLSNLNVMKKRELMSRTLYLMGKPEFRAFKFEDYQTYMRGVSIQQKYLLRSVELDDPNWSRKSAKDLLRMYRHMIKIKRSWPKFKSRDTVLATKKRDKQIRGFSMSVIQKLKQLKALKFPDDQEPVIEQGLFERLGQVETEFKNYLQASGEKTGLTRDAKNRQRIKNRNTTR